MSDDKVVTMPGIGNTDLPVFTGESVEIESKLVDDIGELLAKYNGKVTNVAMIGALQLYSTMVSIGSIGGEE